ncbi:MAG: arylesterase [Parasphingorhabdus sp.]
MFKNLLQYGLALVVLQLLVACGPAPQDAPSGREQVETIETPDEKSEKEADTLVLAFGDSLYAGYGLSQNDGFVPELQRALKAAGKDVKVHNAGVSGDTTAAGLRRMDFVLDSLPKKPDLVILGLGGNDLLRGLKPEDSRTNLDMMVKKLKERDIPVMLTGMVAPINLGKEYGAAFNGIYPDLAKQYGTDLYPFFMDGLIGRSDLILEDGIHPNDKGIDLIVEKITPVVLAAIDKI